jgi:hypothetical protein
VKGFFGLISRITANYPGLRRGSLFIVFIISSQSCFAQLARLDTIVARAIPEIIQPLSVDPIVVSSDTGYKALIAILQQPTGICLKTFFIDYLTAAPDKDDSITNIHINIRGVFLQPGSPSGRIYNLNKTVPVTLTTEERKVLRAKGQLGQTVYRWYQTEDAPVEHSFWSGILEPAIVIIGAAAIVALFFLLRS